jgi:hypothetical protein
MEQRATETNFELRFRQLSVRREENISSSTLRFMERELVHPLEHHRKIRNSPQLSTRSYRKP